jgi:hypothetical protein
MVYRMICACTARQFYSDVQLCHNADYQSLVGNGFIDGKGP